MFKLLSFIVLIGIVCISGCSPMVESINNSKTVVYKGVSDIYILKQNSTSAKIYWSDPINPDFLYVEITLPDSTIVTIDRSIEVYTAINLSSGSNVFYFKTFYNQNIWGETVIVDVVM